MRPKGMSRKRYKEIQNEDPRKYRRFSRDIPTPDEFYPTRPDGTVSVTVCHLSPYHKDDTYCIRTCVWGDDDFGLERDIEFITLREADIEYQRRVKEVSGWAIVTIKMLKELGFISA